MIDILFYHKNCSDGSTAAAAYMARKNKHCNEAHPAYEAVQYGDYDTVESFKEKFDIVGKHVLIVDFSFKWEVMRYLFENARLVVWLDHHKTALQTYCHGTGTEYVEKKGIHHIQHAFGNIQEIVLNENVSGAALMHQWLFSESLDCAGKDTVLDLPKLIQHIQDRDLWKFELPGTKELSCSLKLRQLKLEDWADLLVRDDKVKELIEEGKLINNVYQTQVHSIVGKAQSIKIAGYKGLIVNSGLHISEIGHELAKKSGTFGAVWFWAGSYAVVSLRSLGDLDVSEIAKSFGGGGHRAAAGFKLDLVTLQDMLLKG